jgi:hypothetical protein
MSAMRATATACQALEVLFAPHILLPLPRSLSALGSRLLHLAYCLLPIAFSCFFPPASRLPSYAYCNLPFASCLLCLASRFLSITSHLPLLASGLFPIPPRP